VPSKRKTRKASPAAPDVASPSKPLDQAVGDPVDPSGRPAPVVRLKLPTQSQVFFFLLLALAFYLTWLLFRDFIIFIVAGVFVAVLALPVDRFWERIMPNRPAAVMTMLTVFIIIAGPIVALGFGMYRDATGMANAIQAGALDDLADKAADQDWVQRGLARMYPNETAEQHNATLHRWVDKVEENVQDALLALGNRLLAAIPAFLIGTSIILFVVYYLLTDGEKLYVYVRRAAPLPGRQVDFLASEARRGLRGVFVGQLLLSVLQGLLGGLGFWIAGLPSPVLWGAVMALFALLPVLGTPMIWVPASIYLLIDGHVWQGVFLLVYGTIAILVILDTFVRPVLLGSSTDLHPFFVLVGVLGGAAVFGFIGLFLGPLLIGVLVSVLKVWEREYLDPLVNLDDDPPAPPAPPPGLSAPPTDAVA
jgi:predicted PurR-regulated permease PerM